MVSFGARKPRLGIQFSLLVLSAFYALARSQSPTGQLEPGRALPRSSSQLQPGQVSPNPSNTPSSPTAATQQAGTDPNQAQALPMIFESHGLEYEALTRNGITVMFAPLPPRIKDFNVVQVTVTNGALIAWTVKPGDFSFIKQDGPTLAAASADDVVETLLQSANRDDVIKLQLLYENSISGLSNYRPTNGYEKRREAAMAQFVNRGFKAAAEASAITLVSTKLKPGDSTDGAIFFENRSKEKSLGAGRLIAHTCGESFMFETYGELKKH